MHKDPDQHYLQAILAQTPLRGKTILEFGCGAGDITRQLAPHAARIIAIDPDRQRLEQARIALAGSAVEFIQADDGMPDLAESYADIVLYSLSLHHIPRQQLPAHLRYAAARLARAGEILAIEPGASGPFIEAKKRFGVGSGDEGPAIQAAWEMLQALPGWRVAGVYPFTVDFLFSDEADFLRYKNASEQEPEQSCNPELTDFLTQHRATDGIRLGSGRQLYRLMRAQS
ncbi:class I SAM-dependent methyltransferase [Pelobacter seleniigenes]|uniref:class I SAM-dependent methyltransferase n=1 Tax=Pelobacter seleniigenes TaxID=407188 RepID=UPI0004A6C447|nr:class I SAM-dependent methyltransferase [Pelobacter seleniigenes]